ncbi:MAG TPA: hypothetical protein PKA63_14510 [Oligoflexia bacterium]|nr:hypothetical protein [Oligoflexia bacterium]HMP49878.1 hypothetical protein [Oligoflexia bacterium]
MLINYNFGRNIESGSGLGILILVLFFLLAGSFYLFYFSDYEGDLKSNIKSSGVVSKTAGMLDVCRDRFAQLQLSGDFSQIMAEMVYTEGVDDKSIEAFRHYLIQNLSEGKFRFIIQKLSGDHSHDHWRSNVLEPKGLAMSLPPTHRMRVFLISDEYGEQEQSGLFMALKGDRMYFSISKVVDESKHSSKSNHPPQNFSGGVR